LNVLTDAYCAENTVVCKTTVCNFGQDWEVGYLTGVHTQYKALLPKEITATVGVRIGLRSVNITLLGKKYAQTKWIG